MWKKVGRNGDERNTERREKVGKARTSAKPVRLSAALRICMSLLRCPEKRSRGTEGWGEGPKKWIEKRWARRGRQVQFLTVSHWSPVPSVPSSMPGMVRERERESKQERE